MSAPSANPGRAAGSRASAIIASIVRAVMKPRPIQKVWEWIDAHVEIPVIAGAVNPGPLRTHRFPIYRGLWELYWQEHVRLFTLCKSARVGGTLFAICCVLHKIDIWPQAILWVDPTRKTARDFSRSELQPFIRACKPVAEQAVYGEKTFTTLMMQFKACILRLAGSGSAAELGGFQAEMVVLNERDKLKDKFDRESSSADLAKVRSKQFHDTRKILENSTPTLDTADTWQEFLRGSQHYCYVPCPHCSDSGEKVNVVAQSVSSQDERDDEHDQESNGNRVNDRADRCNKEIIGSHSISPAKNADENNHHDDKADRYDANVYHGYQRLTFFSEDRDVPFDEFGNLLPPGETRLEKTGRVKFEQFKIWHDRVSTSGETERIAAGYDLEAVETGATYECAYCGKDIEHTDLNGVMLGGAHWRQLNPKAPRDHISAHVSALYSPFETWGQLAKKFLQARGSVRRLHDFYNSDLGLPFVRYATTIKEDDLDRVIKRAPRPYVLRELPFKPELLSMCVDVQGFGFWWSIRAWGILWDHPDRPIWSALIDYGPAVSWNQIEEFAGIKPDKDGKYNRYRFRVARASGVARSSTAQTADLRAAAESDEHEVEEYQVTAGLIDSGFEAQQNKHVYDFCLKNAHVFSPSKGGSRGHLRGKIITTAPVWDEKLELVWYFDDYFKQALYYHNIKEQKALWWLPANIDRDYRAQLTAEFTREENGKLVWDVEGEQGNHLGDTEKLHEVLREEIGKRLFELIEERDAAEERDVPSDMQNAK